MKDDVGFVVLLRCTLMGLVAVMLPGVFLVSVVGTQYVVFILLAILYAVVLGGIAGAYLFQGNTAPKRDEKGRFVK